VPSVDPRLAYWVAPARAYHLRGEDVAAVHLLLRAEHQSAEDMRYNTGVRAMVRELLRHENAVTRADLRPLADRMGILNP
jgi:hypothetical protein